MIDIETMISEERFTALRKLLSKKENLNLDEMELLETLNKLKKLSNGEELEIGKIDRNKSEFDLLTDCIHKNDFETAEEIIYSLLDDYPKEKYLYYYLEIIQEIKRVKSTLSDRAEITQLRNVINEIILDGDHLDNNSIDYIRMLLEDISGKQILIGEGFFNQYFAMHILNMIEKTNSHMIARDDFGYAYPTGNRDVDFYNALNIGDYPTAFRILSTYEVDKDLLDESEEDIMLYARLLEILDKHFYQVQTNTSRYGNLENASSISCLLDLIEDEDYEDAIELYTSDDYEGKFDVETLAGLVLMDNETKIRKLTQ